MPISRAVRIIRSAISPRLATKSLVIFFIGTLKFDLGCSGELKRNTEFILSFDTYELIFASKEGKSYFWVFYKTNPFPRTL
jgi:hypothetical protein